MSAQEWNRRTTTPGRFAGDSPVEVLAASVIVWLLSAGRGLVAFIVSHVLYDLFAFRLSSRWTRSDFRWP